MPLSTRHPSGLRTPPRRAGHVLDALALATGVALDAVVGDPRRGHPVAAYGRAVARLERLTWGDSRARGVAFCLSGVAVPAALGVVVQRWSSGRRPARFAVMAAATWLAVAARSLAGEGVAMADELERGDLSAARGRVPHLCARDPSALDADDIARATVESLGENTSDAVVAPLVWGAVLGVPGLLGYRAVNTLDAMVGYRSPRYASFGWAAARLDDAANVVPARLTAALVSLCAPLVAGDRRKTWHVVHRDARHHPSPNAGWPESAFAGALGVTIGGRNVYHGAAEERPAMGDGRPPAVDDVRRAVRLCRSVSAAAAVAAVALRLARGGIRR